MESVNAPASLLLGRTENGRALWHTPDLLGAWGRMSRYVVTYAQQTWPGMGYVFLTREQAARVLPRFTE